MTLATHTPETNTTKLAFALGWATLPTRGPSACRCLQPTDGGFRLGCGRATGRTFAQGHDAQTKRTLQTAHRAGVVDVAVQAGDRVFLTTVQALADVREWGAFLPAPAPRPSKAADPTARLAKLQAEVAKLKAQIKAEASAS